MINAKLSEIRKKENADFVILNVDNAAHGFGITPQLAKEFLSNGADCLTLGNHGFDQKEILPFLNDEPRLIRANNYPKHTPGHGNHLFTLKDGRKITVIHTMGRTYMDPLNCPFEACAEDLQRLRLKHNTDAIVIDIHAEATSEKMALANFLDGRVSAVIGTHTHVPTNDARILPGGTGYQTDAGMCGDYDSVIGFDKKTPIERFTQKYSEGKLEPALGKAELRGCIIDINPQTGLCDGIKPFWFKPD